MRVFKFYSFAGFLGVFLVFAMPFHSYAQGYSGLTVGKKDRTESSRQSVRTRQNAPQPQGYRGLISGQVAIPQARTPNASQRQQAAQDERQQTYYGQSHSQPDRSNNLLSQQNDLRQSFPNGYALPNAIDVQTPEDLKLVALITRGGRDRQINVGNVKINPRTLAVINTPKQKVNGFWPGELRAVNFANAVLNDIRNTPKSTRTDKIESARKQFETMIDINQAQLVTPDTVSLQLGLTQGAIDEKKQEAEATVVQLQKALALLPPRQVR